jgi:hypothetical protein
MQDFIRGPVALLMSVIIPCTALTVGCKSDKTSPESSAQTAQSQPASAAPAPATSAAPINVDDLVAPIALYPDGLLGQVLVASTNPQEVLDGGNWLIQNQNLKGDALTNAAKTAGFTPSMQYLVNFPQVVDNMCQEMDWTTQLGQAYTADQKGVMDAIQRKRGQAQQVGNLTSGPQMTVATQTAPDGQQYVEIKPTDPQVVYVPAYNPVTIYTTPAPAAPAPAPAATTTTTTTTEEKKSGVSTGTAVLIGALAFGGGMLIGHAISNNDNYYPYPSWGYGGMYYGGHPYYPPPYRPVYPGYRPAPYYRPPADYRWNQYNKNVNVNINNNYYGKFNGNNVNRPSTLPANNNRPALGNNNNPGNNGVPGWVTIKPTIRGTGRARTLIRERAIQQQIKAIRGRDREWPTRTRILAMPRIIARTSVKMPEPAICSVRTLPAEAWRMPTQVWQTRTGPPRAMPSRVTCAPTPAILLLVRLLNR